MPFDASGFGNSVAHPADKHTSVFADQHTKAGQCAILSANPLGAAKSASKEPHGLAGESRLSQGELFAPLQQARLAPEVRIVFGSGLFAGPRLDSAKLSRGSDDDRRDDHSDDHES
jgi:hypothetical protein